MKLSIEHETIYRYDAPVRSSTQYLRLTPRETSRQNVLHWQIDTPRAATQTHDGYGNVLHVLTLDKTVREIRIRAHGVIESNPAAEDKPEPGATLSPLVFLRCTALTRPDETLMRFAAKFRRQSAILTGLRDLASEVTRKLPGGQVETSEAQAASQAFGGGIGSVRDQAHVFIASCRHIGIPARFVSGYVLTHGKEEAGIYCHAWTEAWVGDRWRGFDLAHSRASGTEHVALAIGADYLDACPIRGIRTGGGLETMEAHARLNVGQ